MWDILLAILCSPVILVFVLRRYLLQKSRKYLRNVGDDTTSKSVGFFHPYCNSGGGGERVLWRAIAAIQSSYPDILCVVYTGDDISGKEIISNAEKRFCIKLNGSVQFVRLNWRCLVEARLYPHFTLLGQSLGSVILAIEAAFRFLPDIYLDSTGFAFTLPIFKLLGAGKVGCYVHYPTISSDMLSRVSDRTPTYNNAGFVSRSNTFSNLKLTYYKLFAKLYGLNGAVCDVIMVNSTWTKGHITSLWKRNDATIVYPPCNTDEFEKIRPKFDKEDVRIVSIGQFRPEKDHELQLRAFKLLLSTLSERESKNVKLVLIGSCRNSDDESRVDMLKKMCKSLDICDNVIFKLNIPFSELLDDMKRGMIGLHTMWNEHFGIGIVECMSAGLVMVAHNSGGPKLDIVTEEGDRKTGFLADDEKSYSEIMHKIIKMDESKLFAIAEAARESMKRFSEENFQNSFLDLFKKLL